MDNEEKMLSKGHAILSFPISKTSAEGVLNFDVKQIYASKASSKTSLGVLRQHGQDGSKYTPQNLLLVYRCGFYDFDSHG